MVPGDPLAHYGQDNWNAYGCRVSEELLLTTAQAMVDYGLRDLGYYYVILDDCWSSGRTPNGTLEANVTKFPSGMAAIADQIHGMGLGYGMYSSAGAMTCAQYRKLSMAHLRHIWPTLLIAGSRIVGDGEAGCFYFCLVGSGLLEIR